jgi:hypothetical protein
LKTAEQRAAWAAYMARLRSKKKERGECRDCAKPAARDASGRTMACCNHHLDSDADRNKRRRDARKAKS